MPVTMQCRGFSLAREEVNLLWQKVVELRGCLDEVVTVRCVDEQEIRRLNKRYRGKNKATNVLTFSYGSEHDVALCLEVARRDAEFSKKDLKGYLAWLLVHAFLHVAGMDHEGSREEAKKMKRAEETVLESHGF